MDSRTVRVAVIALVAVAALSAAAATLDDTRTMGGGVGPSSSQDAGVADDDGDSVVPRDDRGRVSPPSGGIVSDCEENAFLRSPEFVAAALLVVAVALAVLTWRRNLLVAFAVLTAVGTPLFLVYLFISACPGDPNRVEQLGLAENASINMSAPGGGGAPGSDAAGNVVQAPTVVLAVLGLILLVAVAVVLRDTDDEPVDPREATDEDGPESATVAAIGRVAGETADRIDASESLDNEVYRAWREMVGHLQVDRPDATTPGEFADAAVAAGMARGDVEQLTDLFEAVRYGGVEPTDERERAAVETLRRIEREYAE
ncbi:MAG: DUF4129 domain-containing protein [Halobacteriales archaeon]